MLQLAQLLTNHRLEVNRLESRISDLEKELNNRPQWISVDDRLPEKAGVYLTSWRDNTLETYQFDGSLMEQGWLIDLGAYGRVTHWMPLPEPPTREQGE